MTGINKLLIGLILIIAIISIYCITRSAYTQKGTVEKYTPDYCNNVHRICVEQGQDRRICEKSRIECNHYSNEHNGDCNKLYNACLERGESDYECKSAKELCDWQQTY